MEDIFDNQPSAELHEKVWAIAQLLLGIGNMFSEVSTMAKDSVLGMSFAMTGQAVRAHLKDLYRSDAKIDNFTTAQCYDILFRANEISVPILVEIDRLIEISGATISSISEDGSQEKTSFAEQLRSIIAS